MTAIRPIDVAGDRVFELSDANLANPAMLEHVAASVAAGDYVYCPSGDATPELDSRVLGDRYEPPPYRAHTERLDRPERLRPLGWLLRKRGLALASEGGFYYRVVPATADRRATGKPCAGARP